jgi:hypothetical protein
MCTEPAAVCLSGGEGGAQEGASSLAFMFALRASMIPRPENAVLWVNEVCRREPEAARKIRFCDACLLGGRTFIAGGPISS